MKNGIVALVIGMGLLVVGAGCGKDEKAGEAASGTKSAGGDIGVAECDAYVKAVETCKNTTLKASYQQSLPGVKESFKAMLKMPNGKDSAKTSCKAALDAMTAACNM